MSRQDKRRGGGRWCAAALGLAAPWSAQAQSMVGFAEISGADTAWVLVSAALVLLMTLPGVALFYAGMVRRKNVLDTLAAVLGTACVVSVVWFAVGYSLAFTPGSAWIGGLDRLWFGGLDYQLLTQQVAINPIAPRIPEAAYAIFQMTFAIITAALIVGALVDRMRFGALMLFMLLWSLFVYVPVAHWVWEPNGWLARRGALDFAGGAVVHVNAGAAGLACACYLGRRTGYGREPFQPYNLGWTMLGSSLLWIGWFGFNGGSALAADGRAALAMVVTHLAAACGGIGWALGEWLFHRRISLLGLCSGLVAGLVAVTPAAGYVSMASGAVIGLIAGLVCYWGATGFKRWLGADDALDVFGVHGLGGMVGALLTGVFASYTIAGVHGNVLAQAVAVVVVAVFCFAATCVLMWVTDRIIAVRVDVHDEQMGLDISQHREQVGH